MKKKTYKWLERLIDRITKTEQSNNDPFIYYGRRITLESGTRDYVSVHISDMDYRNQKEFSIDFWTYELDFTSYEDYDERDAIIRAFKRIYNDGWGNVHVGYDAPWEEERKFLEPMVGDEEYDQDCIMKEYEELMSREAA